MRPARPAISASIALTVLLLAGRAGAVVVRVHLRKATDLSPVAIALDRVDANAVRVHCKNISPLEAVCEVPPRSAWRTVADAGGIWVEPKLVTLSESEASVSVSLWRTGDVIGRIARKQAEKAPQSVSIRFEPGRHIGNDLTLPGGSFECPVRDYAFRCEVPAGFIDLRIKARGYIANYFWDASVPAAGKYDAGEIKMAKGAAVVGRVRVAGRGIKPSASITLTPQIGESGDPHSARTAQLSLSATTNDRGFFHIDGVPPGNYVVTARHTGFAPARTTVRVLANIESELIEALSLERVHSIDLVVSPPVDADTHPWRIRLLELGALRAFSPEPLQAKYVAPGLYRIGAIPAGSYQVSVENGGGETFYAQAVEIDGNRSMIPISLSIIAIKGQLRLGDDPLSAAIWFGGRHGPTTLRLDSDAKGIFHGFLPHTGKWQVEIESEDPRVRRVLRNVDVRSRDDGSASLDLTLPATTLKGTVLGPNDVPMAGAHVNAKTSDALVQTISDPAGHFELHGLPAGPANLTASAGGGKYSSEDLHISLNEDHATEADLHLRESLTLSGMVSSGGIAVPGATVMLWPTNDLFPSFKPISTSADGAFNTSVPASTTSVNVTVLAPGFALYARRFDIQSTQNIGCEISQRGGNLTIERKSDPAHSALFLMHDGVPIFAPILAQWIRLHEGIKPSGSSLTVSDLEPGLFVGCIPDATISFAAIARGARPLDRCANVTVAPLSEVTMRLP